jgi:ABC-type lipoprotein release transport system permease subunit
VALGVAVSSAVIVGALLVGDSMRGSLKDIAMDRIGSIDSVVLAPRWFDAKRLDQAATVLASTDGQPAEIHGLLLLPSVVAELQDRSGESEGKIITRRSTELTLLGTDEAFWNLGSIRPSRLPKGNELVLNASLAEKLDAQVGDRVTLKVSRDAVVPADSALGKRENEVIALSRWEVVDILPDKSLARFSLKSDQRPVQNVFADKAALQSALDIENKINTVMTRYREASESVSKRATVKSTDPSANSKSSLSALQLELDDLGLKWERIDRVFPDPDRNEQLEGDSATQSTAKVYSYDQLTSEQMMIADPLADAIQGGMKVASKDTVEIQGQVATSEKNGGANIQTHSVLSYLANNTEVIAQEGTAQESNSRQNTGRSVPYSTISGVSWDVLSRMLADSGVASEQPTGEDWVVINSWMARELQAQVGDRLRFDYFLPETVEGTEVETNQEVRLHAIAPLSEPSTPYRRKSSSRFSVPPTPFNDPSWTPVVPGITDQDSISNWETPFALTRKIEKIDDEYWNAHRLTPKLFISESLSRRIFGSRFGSQTSLRFDGLSAEERLRVGERIASIAREKTQALGWRELPLRAQQLQAANGTTPFDALFLSLSFFVIAAALILVALLFRLTIEKRANHWGLLMASGWTRSKVRRLLLLEATIVAGVGSAIGVALGVLYAYGLLAALKTWWVGAISVSFLEFHIRPASLWIGWLAGLLVSLLATLFVTRQLRSTQIARLIKGKLEEQGPSGKVARWVNWTIIGSIIVGFIAMLAGQWVQGQAQAGAFVASGMCWMIAGVLWLYRRFQQDGTQSFAGADKSLFANTEQSPSLGLSQLARSSAQRSPVRSLLTVALMAMASFLILSMSLFQGEPDRRGTGGFAWVGKSSQSIHVNIADPKEQRQVLGDKANALQGSEIVQVRVRGGDDASCNNLFQANEPQVMGVSQTIAAVDQDKNGRTEFAWFGTNTSTSPWVALEATGEGTVENPVPVILDQNTALWALHLGGYVGERFRYSFGGKEVHFKTVGVLQNTVLQGSLWIGEKNFQKVFPDVGGYRMFLVKPSRDSQGDIGAVSAALEDGWADEGLSCASTEGVLQKLLAVQNTYLSAFQLLGALGLLLGTIGLGVTQLRNAMERKSELGAMRAMGFPRSRLIWALFLENGWQLLRGVGIGMLCALAASLPILWQKQTLAGVLGPLSMLAWVIGLGLVFCIAAAYLAMREPLLRALRAEH